VWDKDADPWMRNPNGRGFPGGVWTEARIGLGVPGTRNWAELISAFGPLTDYEPRCEAFSMVVGDDRESFRCLLAPNHSGHHKLPETCWSTP
jgi:hypothetical protein